MISGSFYLSRGRFTLDVDFKLPSHSLTVIQGPSGAGKSQFLRCLAGLERAEKGKLLVNEVCWEDSDKGFFLPTHKRNIGYVFQEHNLFPHLSPLKNLLYGYKRLKTEKQIIDPDKVIEVLRLEKLLKQPILTLSGGEKQRIAIGRSLLINPELLLMDEPVASLDEDAKNEILNYIKALQKKFTFTIIYVTHGSEEIKKLGKKPLKLIHGRIHQKH